MPRPIGRRDTRSRHQAAPAEWLDIVGCSPTLILNGATIARHRATTLYPTVRTLLQVKVNHTDEAEEIFSTLMGDIVEPRRDFIQQNALNVANLDV